MVERNGLPLWWIVFSIFIYLCFGHTIQVGNAATISGLDFPGTAVKTMRFKFSNPQNNGLPIYGSSGSGVTYIWRVYPRQKAGYYTTFFWGNDDGQENLCTFLWVGSCYAADSFYGAHPYPNPPPSGTAHNWEIAVEQMDFQNGVVAYNRWYTQALRVWSDGSGKHHEFYWDLPNTDENHMVTRISPTTWGNTNPPSPALTWGDAPWAPGNEVYNGIIRGIRVYSGLLSVNDMLSEASSPLSTTAGASKIWYLNMDPTPTDISDKSGKGHDPVWVGSERPGLYTDQTGPPVSGSLGAYSLSAFGSVDFNGDGMTDILWRHAGGALCLWEMDGLTAKSVSYIPPIDPSWLVNGLGDFNGDGMTDILWRHTGGMLYTWMMNGETAIGLGSPGTVDLSWSVVGAADFGGDGKADILWRHTSGALCLWEMNGISALKVSYIPSIDVSWQVKALADFNGDGKADILWRHTSGMLYLWLMDGAKAIGLGSPGTVDLNWTITGVANFTDDMKADILWRDTSGAMAIWQMDGARLMNVAMLGAVDLSWSIADAHDFNGDSRADILWRHTSGATALWLMNGFTWIGGGSLGAVDPSWHIENQ